MELWGIDLLLDPYAARTMCLLPLSSFKRDDRDLMIAFRSDGQSISTNGGPGGEESGGRAGAGQAPRQGSGQCAFPTALRHTRNASDYTGVLKLRRQITAISVGSEH